MSEKSKLKNNIINKILNDMNQKDEYKWNEL